jgi:hypothetical protein
MPPQSAPRHPSEPEHAGFDTGVGAVAGVEEGGLAGAGVGRDTDAAPAVTVLDEVQLRTGMGRSRRTMMRVPGG